MRSAELTTRLEQAVRAQGMAPGPARRRRGVAAVTLVWLRPEPVVLRADAAGRLVLEGYLPFVVPGGPLLRAVEAFLAARRPDAVCTSRDRALSIGLPGDDWPAVLATLLALAGDIRAMLDAEWPDYARGVFAPSLA